MSQRILVYMVEPVEVGYEFERSNWPLHITLVPWFEVTDQNWFTGGLVDITGKQSPIALTVGNKELFGHKRNIPVSIVVPNKELKQLHNKLLRLVKEWGTLQSDKFVASKYRAHVTHYGERSLTIGTELLMDNICIVELINDSTCKVAAKYELF